MKNTYFLLLTCVILNAFSGRSQDISFHHLTTEDGLSQITVKSLYEDERGFIWAGTNDGLNLYNGTSIQSFRYDSENANSLISYRVENIVGNKKGKIFLRCNTDVMEYDIKQEKFKTLLLGDISTIYYNQHLYAARNNTILIYDEQTEKFEPFYSHPNKQAIITSLYISGNELCMGTSNMGFFVLKNKQLNQIIKNINIVNIFKDSKRFYWISTDKDGLFLTTSNQVIRKFKYVTGDPSSLPSDIVRDCCEDEIGGIWVATFNGLARYDKKTGTFKTYAASSKINGLNHSSIHPLLRDHQGSIWLGTHFGGINFFHPKADVYTVFKAAASESQGLSYPVVGKTMEDKYGNIWVCTEGGGLNIYNPKTGTFKWYLDKPSIYNISHSNVKALYCDEKADVMWVGTHWGGLYKINMKSEEQVHYNLVSKKPGVVLSNTVRDILPYKGKLILGTQLGVYMFDPSTGFSEKMFENIKGSKAIQIVVDLLLDYKGVLWMAVEGEGAYSYNFSTQKLTNLKHNQAIKTSISYNDINSILEDSKHNLWFSTAGAGIDVYHPNTDEFEHFDTKNSTIANSSVYQVYESSPGVFLVVLSNGLARFDYSKKQFDNFNLKNGFPLSSVVTNSFCMTRSGVVYMGGVQGLISFRLKDLYKKSKSYSISPARLFVNDLEVKVGDETGILDSALYCSKQIKIPSQYKTFSLELGVSNYINTKNVDLVYQIEGLSKSWTKVPQQNLINFTNISPGDYTLVIKAIDLKGESLSECRLQLAVLPPFYRTNLAYLIYFILLGFIVNYLRKINNSKIKLEESLKYEQKHIQDVEKDSHAKLEFFTNISHEFRTPLTLIIGQMEMLLQMRTLTPIVYNKMLGVYKNGLHLRELISELLDFRKQEQGMMKIKVSEHDLIHFLQENYLMFAEFAKSKKVNFQFNKSAEKLLVWFDAQQLQKVINNLLSNAFKFTPKGGEINIEIKTLSDKVLIEISDSGKGIASDELKRVFDPFYQVEQSSEVLNTGTGIGLALTKGIMELHHGDIEVVSEIDKGTVFTISLLLGKDHFELNEISESNEFIIDEKEYFKVDADFNLEQNFKEENANQKKDQKLLIVEDNAALREMLVSIFEAFYIIITAEDGEDGLAKVKSEQPNLVLSDIMMPKMYGTELCKQIKEDIDTCHIPVVLLTARTSVEQNLEGLRIGADDYIAKPFNTSLLLTRCNNLVNSRIVLQEKFGKQPQVTPRMLATNTMDKELMDKIMVIVEKYIDKPEFDIATFASEIGMSRSVLFTKIKGITGQTPNDFVNTIRIKKSAVMLQNNPELNVTEISELLGFNSSRYFGRLFKAQYHVSPMSFRKGLTSDEEEVGSDNTL